MNHQPLSELAIFVTQLRQGIWFFGIPSWLFGLVDRSAASWADQSLSAGDLIQVFTAALFLVSWLLLKPTSKLGS
jgi:hypothetical protein